VQEVQTLMRAAENGDIDAIEALLAQGIDVNAKRNDGMTPLIRAAFFGHVDTVAVLLNKGADAGIKDRLGVTALGWASSRGHADVIHLLENPASAHDRVAAMNDSAKNVVAPIVTVKPPPPSEPPVRFEQPIFLPQTSRPSEAFAANINATRPVSSATPSTSNRNFRRLAVAACAIFFVCTALVYTYTQSRNRASGQINLTPLAQEDAVVQPTTPATTEPATEAAIATPAPIKSEATPQPAKVVIAAPSPVVASEQRASSDIHAASGRKAKRNVRSSLLVESAEPQAEDNSGRNNSIDGVELKREERVDEPRQRQEARPADSNNDDQRTAVTPPVVPRRDTPVYEPPPALNPSPTPKKKVIQWP